MVSPGNEVYAKKYNNFVIFLFILPSLSHPMRKLPNLEGAKAHQSLPVAAASQEMLVEKLLLDAWTRTQTLCL